MIKILLYLFTAIISINCGEKVQTNRFNFDDDQKDTIVITLYVYPRSDISKGYKFSLYSNKIFNVEKGITSLGNIKLFSETLNKGSLSVNEKEFDELLFLKEKIISSSSYIPNKGIRGGTEICLELDSVNITFYYESEKNNNLRNLYDKLRILSPIKIE